VDDRLSAARLRAELGDNILIGREIIVRDQTTSTNDCVWQLAQEGAYEGLVVFAEHQTAGRGQRGNVWESAPHKDLSFSVLLQPKIGIGHSSRLTQWASEIIGATIESSCLCQVRIKAPNDIFVGERKVAGVLVEMRAQANAQHIAILGIGVNINQQLHDFSVGLRVRSGSLAMLGHKTVDRHEFAAELLRNLDRSYRQGAV